MSDKQKLEKILSEYKSFLSIISHDFAAPLRHLENFTELLTESLAGKLNEEEEEYICFINGSVSKLKNMQDELLVLSRVYTRAEKHREVDFNKLVGRTVESLQGFIKQNNADIKIEDLPTIKVDEQQLKIVFKKIIHNAILYKKEGDQQKIRISAETKDNEVIFCIEDIGIGIQETLQTRIFDMFRRLHAEGNYGDGIGSGLAICKAIIEDHGGKIWVESSEGEGSKFFFSLPDK